MTQKLRPGLDTASARADVKALLSWKPIGSTEQVLELAWDIQDQFSLSWWDSLIVASASEQDCSYLLSEDMQHGLRVGDMLIQNPFRIASGDLL